MVATVHKETEIARSAADKPNRLALIRFLPGSGFRLVLYCLVLAGFMSSLAAQGSAAAGALPVSSANPALGWFEKPHTLGSGNLRYEQSLQFGERLLLLYQRIQQDLNSASENGGGEIAVVGRIIDADGKMGEEFAVVSGLPYVGLQPPPLYSAAMDAKGRVYVAYSADAQTVALIASQTALAVGNKAVAKPAFVELGRLESDITLVSIRLYLKAAGGFALLATQSSTTGQNSVYSSSADGKKWAIPQMIDASLKDNINASPAWAESGKREFIVFQSLNFTTTAAGVANYYQLYLSRSDDAGLTWLPPVLLSGFLNPGDKAPTTAVAYDNQRPLLVATPNKLTLFWERSLRTDPRQIWAQQLDAEGAAAGLPQKVTNFTGGAFAPVWQSYRGREYLAWFSASARGSRAFLSWLDGSAWQNREMSAGRAGTAYYPAFGFTNNKLHFFYYDRTDTGVLPTSLVYVEPDQSARPPVIVGLNFDNRQRAAHQDIRFRFLPNNQPEPDAAGIAGYSFVVSAEPNAPVPQKLSVEDASSLPPFTLDADGTWFVRARAVDKAGNWSEPATISYTLDTTPPDPVAFNPVAVDEKGYLASNTFTLSWKTPPQDDVADYGWSLQYLGNISLTEAFAKVASLGSLPEMGRQQGLSLARRNVADGIYVLAVWSYDQVGNRSEPRIIQLYANKYVPSTIVDFVTVKEDLLGERYLSVQGAGFTQQGTIVRLVLDRDGVAPWDYEFFLAKGDFQVASDALVSGLKLDKLLSGNYLLGVEHSERGFEFSGRRLQFIEHGVIKFGDFTLGSDTSFISTVDHGIKVQGGSLLLYLVMVLLAFIIVFSGFQIRAVWRDAQLLEKTALALADGTDTPVREAQQKVQSMKRQRMGLRIKFIIFFLILVMAVVLLISLPLSSYTLGQQKAVLAKGLQDRLEVLMESLQSSSTIYLQNPDSYGTELARLVSQGQKVEEVSYITISAQGRPKVTVQGSEESANFDTVWASSDKALTGADPAGISSANPILQRKRLPYTDAATGTLIADWTEGRSGISDSLSPTIEGFRTDFDNRFRTGLGNLPAEMNAVSAEINSLSKNTTKDGLAKMTDLSTKLQAYRSQLDAKQRNLAGSMLSSPTFDYVSYDAAVTDYIFYLPVYFRNAKETDPNTARYYRGLVRVGVSTAPINKIITSTQSDMLQRILLFALLAIAGGLVGAIIMSSIIVIPIRRLVKGVQEIREIITLEVQAQETRFDQFIKEGSMNLKSGDELATLGGSIGEMVDGLWHAASANKELVAGADIQRMFMPLDLIDGMRGTIGGVETKMTEIFGYYEGAKGVSGDFINFEQISPGVWACIKCDISGKGIPAALIMVEVATIFLSYFADWQRKESERKKMVSTSGKALKNDGILVPLVTTINDLVYDRQFKGKFAAFNIVLYEETTGACIFCHAGDLLVYILRDKNRQVETIKLQSTPAAGMFSSKEQFPPFFRCREERNLLEVGDYLMFFTDGIDESRRFFRNPDFSLYLATQADVDAGRIPDEDHGTVAAQNAAPDGSKLYEYEQFTWDRMIVVAETVRRRGVYRLVKYLNPVADELLEFDFSDLECTGHNIVVALAAVEKVFRLIPDPKVGPDDRIKIDKVVDDFLKVHFRQYSSYFRYRRDDVKYPLYYEYTHMREEDQYDDLAFLIIKRK